MYNSGFEAKSKSVILKYLKLLLIHSKYTEMLIITITIMVIKKSISIEYEILEVKLNENWKILSKPSGTTVHSSCYEYKQKVGNLEMNKDPVTRKNGQLNCYVSFSGYHCALRLISLPIVTAAINIC